MIIFQPRANDHTQRNDVNLVALLWGGRVLRFHTSIHRQLWTAPVPWLLFLLLSGICSQEIPLCVACSSTVDTLPCPHGREKCGWNHVRSWSHKKYPCWLWGLMSVESIILSLKGRIRAGIDLCWEDSSHVAPLSIKTQQLAWLCWWWESMTAIQPYTYILCNTSTNMWKNIRYVHFYAHNTWIDAQDEAQCCLFYQYKAKVTLCYRAQKV